MTEFLISGATLRSLNGKPPAEDGGAPLADLVLRADVTADMQFLLARVGKSFAVDLVEVVAPAEGQPAADQRRRSFVGVTLKSLSGKPGAEANDSGQADVALRLDVDEGVQELLALVGKPFTATLVLEVEQLGMFVENKTDESPQQPAGALTEGDDDEKAEESHDEAAIPTSRRGRRARTEPTPIASAPSANGNGVNHETEDWSGDERPPKLDDEELARLAKIGDSE